MPDDAMFETDLQGRLRTLSGIASRPFNAGEVARTAVVTGARPRAWSSLGLAPRAALVLGLLALAIVGTALVGSRLLTPAPQVPAGILAIATPDGLSFTASDGSDALLVEGRGPAFGPRWSPDGSTVAATVLLPDDANTLIFLHADGDEYGRSGQVSSFRWSRDSRAVAILGMAPLDLRVQDARTGEASDVRLPEGSLTLSGVDWLPDGRLVAGITPSGQVVPRSALWILDPAGAAPVSMGPGDADNGAGFPAVSPDGTRVATISDACDARNECRPIIRILDTASGQRRAEITNVRQPGVELAFSPDGSQLAFDSVIGEGQREVFAWDLVSGEVRQMTDASDGPAWLNGWTPDGTALLVSQQGPDGAGTRTEIWRIELATASGTRLADDAWGAALQPVP